MIDQLGFILQNSSSLPATIKLETDKTDKFHRIWIQKRDLDYSRQFYESYNSLIPCLNEYLKKNESNLNQNYYRYVYYGADKYKGRKQRGKAIHYYKNVKTMRPHYAIAYLNNSWLLNPLIKDGHFMSHFRKDMKSVYGRDKDGSIRNLNIDYEYLFFLLKNHTKFCRK